MNPVEAQQFLVILMIVQLWLVLFGLMGLFSVLRQMKQKQEGAYATLSKDTRATQTMHTITSENPNIEHIFEHTTDTSEVPAFSIATESGTLKDNAEANSVIKHRSNMKKPKAS